MPQRCASARHQSNAVEALVSVDSGKTINPSGILSNPVSNQKSKHDIAMAIPARHITSIGCHLMKNTITNAATHIATLLITSVEAEPKLAEFISNSAAEAISPTTT